MSPNDKCFILNNRLLFFSSKQPFLFSQKDTNLQERTHARIVEAIAHFSGYESMWVSQEQVRSGVDAVIFQECLEFRVFVVQQCS